MCTVRSLFKAVRDNNYAKLTLMKKYELLIILDYFSFMVALQWQKLSVETFSKPLSLCDHTCFFVLL